MLESRYTAPGDSIVVVDSPVGCLGLSTCYDVRFPEMYISLVKKGAQVSGPAPADGRVGVTMTTDDATSVRLRPPCSCIG
jgi:predicted amidohydrolase